MVSLTGRHGTCPVCFTTVPLSKTGRCRAHRFLGVGGRGRRGKGRTGKCAGAGLLASPIYLGSPAVTS